ncbi:hypothetical protein Csa_016123, partial [Cucumis sativus]
MLLYCIMKVIPVDVDEIICEHIEAWLHHQREANPFSHLIERLYLKACPELKKFPQVACSRDGMCNAVNLRH